MKIFFPWETKLKEIDQQNSTSWRSRSIVKEELSSVKVSYMLNQKEKNLFGYVNEMRIRKE